METSLNSQILFISGPSGGGKSAFIRQLRQGSLPPEIAQRLPPQAATWDLIEANDILKNDIALPPLIAQLNAGKCFIVHYDIVFIHCRHLSDYALDPAMQLFDHTAAVQLLWIRPEPEDLRRQFSQRSQTLLKRKSLGSRLWASIFRKPMRLLIRLVKGEKMHSTKDFYAKSEWISWCYELWHRHLLSLQARFHLAPILVIAPDGRTAQSEQFQLIELTTGTSVQQSS